ncbi:MAG: ParB/RepB/Spo0J family partition protein [FCB group bacterium]|nr:ParB/RepB/Spo0J family partition protein [FCB group bacterium]
MSNKGLGKGIRALIDTYSTEQGDRYVDNAVPTESIVANRSQPRQRFDEEGMRDLIESIRENGILQPLTVHEIGDGTFELIAGERRLRAAQELGIPTVPVYVISVETDVEMLELALVENIQRENLDPMEEAEGYALLSGKYSLTQEAISKRVSKSRAAVANSMRLLKLPPKVKDALRSGKISTGHGRAILGLGHTLQIENAYQRILRDHLSVRQTEQLVNSLLESGPKSGTKKSAPRQKTSEVRQIEEQLRNTLGTKVSIQRSRSGKGNIQLDFYSDEDLTRLMELILSINS